MKKSILALVFILLTCISLLCFASCEDEHTHSYTHTVVEPTCTQGGYTLHECSCGDSYKDTPTNAIGHVYGDLVPAKSATCVEEGYATHYHCDVCDTYFDESKTKTTWAALATVKADHVYGDLVFEKPATCEEDGYAEHYHCANADCGKYFTSFYIETTWEKLVFSSYGHDYGTLVHNPATCTTDGYNDYYKCSRCNTYFDSTKKETTLTALAVGALGHDYGEMVTEFAVSCTKDGNLDYYKCQRKECECYFDKDKNLTTQSAVIFPALGHDFGEGLVAKKPATCVEDGWDAHYYCGTCKTYFDQREVATTWDDLLNEKHEPNLTDYTLAKAATCTSTGYRKYSTCEYCGMFYDENDDLTTWDELVTPKLPHNYGTKVAALPVSCTAYGYNAYYKCSDCNNYFDESKDETTWDELVIASPGHNYGDLVKSVAVSCTADGNHAYYHCDRCNTYFDSGKNKISQESIAIKSSGHNCGTLVHCPVTCATDGYSIDYYYCNKCQKYLNSSKNVINLEDYLVKAAGHDYGNFHDKKAASGCTNDGHISYRQCSKCEKYFNMDYEEKTWDEIVLKASHDFTDLQDIVSATCTQDGLNYHYKCTKCKKYFNFWQQETSYDELVIPAHGHKLGQRRGGTSATCLKEGYKSYYSCDYSSCTYCFAENDTDCTNAKLVSDFKIPALGHNYGNLVSAKAATTAKAGNSAYYHCSICDWYFDSNKNQTTWDNITIGVQGHTYSDLIAQQDPTCTAKGLAAHYECTGNDCNLYFNLNKDIVSLAIIELSPTNHDYTDLGSSTPTCTTRGYKQHYVCFDCSTFFDENKVEKSIGELQIPALGHTYSNLQSLEPTCTQHGYKPYYRCTVCDEWFDEQKEWVYEFEVKINPLGHNYGNLVAASATCTEAGLAAYYYCGTCKTYFDAEKTPTTLDKLKVPAYNHKTKDLFTAKDTTCTKDGNRAYSVCRYCGTYFDEMGKVADKESLIIKTLGHNYDDEVVAPTCSKQGYTQHTCSTCGYICKDTPVAAFGHNYVDDACITCKEPRFKLILTLSDDGNYYIVSGMLGGISELEIPAQHYDKPVTEIAASAFEGRTDLTSVTIPTSITTIGEKAFFNCVNLDVTIVGDLEEAGSGLYKYNADSQLSSIGNYAFSNTAISTIAFPNSLTVINEGVFDGCTKLDTVHFHGGLTKIGDYAFRNTGVKKLPKITQMEEIGISAFEGCTKLTEISLYGLTRIRERAFAGSGITGELKIPNYVTAIHKEAFMDCKNITKLTVTPANSLDKGLNTISSKAFFGCTSLKEVDIQRIRSTTAYAAFGGCTSLEIFKMPYIGRNDKGTTKYADRYNLGWFFGGADVIDMANTKGLTAVTQFYDENKTKQLVYYIPSSLKQVVVYEGAQIWVGAFSNCNMIESIDIRSGAIKGYAFEGCIGLKALSIQKGNRYNITIEPHAFDGLYNLKELYVTGVSRLKDNNSVRMPTDDLLKDCMSLEKLAIPVASANHIGTYFSASSTDGTAAPRSLKSVTVCDSDSGYLRSGFFKGCTGITDVTIGEGITLVGGGLFEGCPNVKNVVIGNDVTHISTSALQGCSALESLTIPFVGTDIDTKSDQCKPCFGEIFGYTEYSGSYAVEIPSSYANNFYSHYYIPGSLTSVTVTGGEIERFAFSYYTSITDIGLKDVNLNYGSFYHMENLQNLYLYGYNINVKGSKAVFVKGKPLNLYVESLDDWLQISKPGLFKNSAGHIYVDGELLSGEVVIPRYIMEVKASAFSGMLDITSVVFEAGVAIIADDAFRDCANITSITLPRTIETIGQAAFLNCTGIETVTLPESLKNLGYYAFQQCTNLTTLTVKCNNLDNCFIGAYAFDGCSKLVNVTGPAKIIEKGLVPATVTHLTITSGVVSNLNNLPALISLTLEDGVTKIDANVCTEGCGELTTLNIGKGLATWTNGAFSSCSKLQTITVSAGNTKFKVVDNALYSFDGKTKYFSAKA